MSKPEMPGKPGETSRDAAKLAGTPDLTPEEEERLVTTIIREHEACIERTDAWIRELGPKAISHEDARHRVLDESDRWREVVFKLLGIDHIRVSQTFKKLGY
jgi:hypothetical protein